jgi:hypothetical protein
MVIKTWIHNFDRDMRSITAPEMRAKERECRFQSLMWWRVHWVVALLPFLVQLSLAVFAAGLFLFLKPLHKPSAYVILSVSSLALLFYLVITFIPLTNEFCPFSLPFTRECRRLLQWEKAALIVALQRWQSGSDTPPEEDHTEHYELSSEHPGLFPPPPATEVSSSQSPWYLKRVLWGWINGTTLAFHSVPSFFSAFWAVHVTPLREKVNDLARERQRQRQSIQYTKFHPQITRSLLRDTVAAPEHLPVYISVLERSQDPHIRPQDWRLVINILYDLQLDVGALSQAEAQGVLYVLGSVYEDPLVGRELSLAKALCSRFGREGVNSIDAVLRHLLLGRIFAREKLIHLWHWNQASAKIRALEPSETTINSLIWVSSFIAKYPTLPSVQRQHHRESLMRESLQLLRSLLIFAGTVPISISSRSELLTAIYSATIFVGNAFLDGVWPHSHALLVVHDTTVQDSIPHPLANLLHAARSQVKTPSGSLLCTLFVPCLLLNGEHPSRWSNRMWLRHIINSFGVTDRFGLTAWTSGLEGLWDIYEADPSRLLGCMAYLAWNCYHEQTTVDQIDVFLKEYDTYTQGDHARMDVPTLHFLQSALERTIKHTTEETIGILDNLRSGLCNSWLRLHIETTCGVRTSLTVQELESMCWSNSPALDNIANRRIALYTLEVVPLEGDLLKLFCQTSSFTTHFNLLCLYTKLSSPHGTSGNRNESPRRAIQSALYFDLLEHLDFVVATTFRVHQIGMPSLLDYLTLVEQLQPRWMALPRPWRSTFATLFTRRNEAIAWMIAVAHSLIVELKERGLEGSTPQRRLPPELNDYFIPDCAHSLHVRFHAPVRKEPAASQVAPHPSGGAAVVSHEQQIGPRYLDAASALLPFLLEMLREVNSSPPDE